MLHTKIVNSKKEKIIHSNAEKFLKELITPRVLVSVAAVIIGIYFVKKSNKTNIVSG